MADCGKKPNPGTQLCGCSSDAKKIIADAIDALQGLVNDDTPSEIAASFDKRKHVLESQKSQALKEVKTFSESTRRHLTGPQPYGKTAHNHTVNNGETPYHFAATG